MIAQPLATRMGIAAVVLCYAVLGLVILSPESVYSGDIGVKYVQARALANQRFSTLDIPYPGEFIDPQREFFPLRPPFVMSSGGATQAIFPPAAAVLQAIAIELFGFRGLIALSIVGAAITLWSASSLAPRLALAVVIALGVGGPLWFYAISGWEHAPAIALGTAAFAVAMHGTLPLRLRILVAGALVGAGATLRDEVILVVPGLLLAAWLMTRSWRSVTMTFVAALVPLIGAASLEVGWFGRPPAAHLRHAVHLLQSAIHVTSAPNPDVPVLQAMTPRERYDTVVVYWMFGRGTDPQVIGFTSALALALLIRWRWRSSIGILLWLLAIGATAAGDMWEVLTAPKWLAGLIRVSPYVVFAILPLPFLPAGRREPDATHDVYLRVIAGVTTVTFLVLAFAGVDTSGGKSLGPRLLLPLLPLLTVSAMITMAAYWRSPGIVDRAVGWTGAAFVAMAVAIHVGGTIPAYRARNADDASAIVAASASPARIVVADDPFTAQLLFPLYDRKIIFLADTPALAERLGGVIADRRIADALVVSRNPEPAVGLSPLRLDRSEQRGRMVLQYWRR